MKARLRSDLLDPHQMPLVMSAQTSLPYIPLDQLCNPTQEFEAFQPERIKDSEFNLIIISDKRDILLANSIDFNLTEGE